MFDGRGAIFPVRVWIRKKPTWLINNDVDNGDGLRTLADAARYYVTFDSLGRRTTLVTGHYHRFPEKRSLFFRVATCLRISCHP